MLPAGPVAFDVHDADFRFDDEALSACRRAGARATCPFGPMIISYDAVSHAVRRRDLVHDPVRQLAVSGVTDEAVLRWFSRLAIFSYGGEHAALRAGMAAELAGPAFEPAAAVAGARRALEGFGSGDAVTGVADVVVDGLVQQVLGLAGPDFAPLAQPVRDLALVHRFDPLPSLARAGQAAAAVHEMLAELAPDRAAGATRGDLRIWMRVAMSLVIGFEPLRLAIGIALAAFAEHPAQWPLLRAAEGAARGAEEVMRWMPSAPLQIRFATADTVLDEHRLQAGDPVLLCALQANRAAEPDGDVFRADRRRVRPHVSFGGGPHHCPAGSSSTRQLAAVLHVLATERDAPQLTANPVWGPPSGLQGPERLELRLPDRLR